MFLAGIPLVMVVVERGKVPILRGKEKLIIEENGILLFVLGYFRLPRI